MRRATRTLFMVVLMVLMGAPGLAVAQNDLNCADFPNQAAAQRHLNSTWPADPDRLDADDDGRACETFFGGYSHSVPNAKDQHPDPTATSPAPEPTDSVTPKPTSPASTVEATDIPLATPVVPGDHEGPIDNGGDQGNEVVTALPTTGAGDQDTGLQQASLLLAIVALLGVVGALMIRLVRR